MGSFSIQGFTAGPAPRAHSFVTFIQGMPKSGKTTLALSAPGPVAVINIDGGLDGLPAYLAHTDIHVANYKVPPLTLYGDSGIKDAMKPIVAAIEKNCHDAIASGARTLVVDTWSEYTEMARLAEFGRLTEIPPKDYQDYNARLRNLLRSLEQEAEGRTNLVICFQVKHAWGQTINDRSGKLQGVPLVTPDGQPVYERIGWKGEGYFSQMELETRYTPPTLTSDGRVVRASKYVVRVVVSRDNGGLSGTAHEGVDLPTLWSMASPDLDWTV